jgi:hypothetical protein
VKSPSERENDLDLDRRAVGLAEICFIVNLPSNLGDSSHHESGLGPQQRCRPVAAAAGF